MRYDYLILGGGIAGASAAEELRRRDANGTIAIIAEERHPLYSRVLLPHVADRRSTKEKAILKTAADFAAKNIEYLTGLTAVRVMPADNAVALSDGRTLEYGQLLIATGASMRRFGGPGAEHCLQFRTLEDLEAFERATVADRVLVYGAGFNALDLAASFMRRGVKVVAAMRGDGFLSRVVDATGMAMIHRTLTGHGMEIRPRTELVAVEKAGERQFVAFFADGSKETFGAVAVSVGVEPNIGFLAGSGVATDVGVVTDERLRVLRADVPGAVFANIFAAGDVAEYLDTFLGDRRIAGNWQNGMFQGRTAAANMAGTDGANAVFDMITTYSIPCFELPICVVGATDGPNAHRVTRITAAGAALQFVLVNDRVVGVSCIGPFSERVDVAKLITSRKAFSEESLRMLQDGNVALGALL